MNNKTNKGVASTHLIFVPFKTNRRTGFSFRGDCSQCVSWRLSKSAQNTVELSTPTHLSFFMCSVFTLHGPFYINCFAPS